MSEHEKPLPTPPNTPFGKKRRFEEPEDKEPLMADRMAMAMAEGKLDEFMQKAMPENEHARSLAMMMMGMTGMMPPGIPPAGVQPGGPAGIEAPPPSSGEAASYEQPPEDVVRAAQAGDANALMGLLQREHAKRMQERGEEPVEGKPAEGEAAKSGSAQAEGISSEEKDVLDALLRIALDNKLELDWMIARALKLYVQEYGKTGRL